MSSIETSSTRERFPIVAAASSKSARASPSTSAEAPFAIGIANPTYATQGPVFEYRGEATLTYVGEEDREMTPCVKYKIEGEGMKNRSGFVWFDRDEKHIVDLEANLPNHPDWTTLKLKLASKEKLKPEDWKAFMKARLDG